MRLLLLLQRLRAAREEGGRRSGSDVLGRFLVTKLSWRGSYRRLLCITPTHITTVRGWQAHGLCVAASTHLSCRCRAWGAQASLSRPGVAVRWGHPHGCSCTQQPALSPISPLPRYRSCTPTRWRSPTAGPMPGITTWRGWRWEVTTPRAACSPCTSAETRRSASVWMGTDRHCACC